MHASRLSSFGIGHELAERAAAGLDAAAQSRTGADDVAPAQLAGRTLDHHQIVARQPGAAAGHVVAPHFLAALDIEDRVRKALRLAHPLARDAVLRLARSQAGERLGDLGLIAIGGPLRHRGIGGTGSG
ncbi:hypothetical protein QU38_02420, partial [Staphylococcus aureus]